MYINVYCNNSCVSGQVQKNLQNEQEHEVNEKLKTKEHVWEVCTPDWSTCFSLLWSWKGQNMVHRESHLLPINMFVAMRSVSLANILEKAKIS